MKIDLPQFERVIKKYYLLQMSQKEVAVSENLSAATVSRLLKRAVEQGYVKIRLELPAMTRMELETELKKRFHLQYVSVVRADMENQNVIAHDVSVAVARYLNQLLVPGDVVGINWGTTMDIVANHLIPKEIPDLRIVGLHGGVSCNPGSAGAESIIRRFADNFHGTGYMLPVPSVVDNRRTADMLRQDSTVRSVLELISQTTVLLFSVGTMDADSVLVERGYFSVEEYESLRKKGYVGDICSRHYKADGSHENDELYHRVVGIDLEMIRRKKTRIGVVLNGKKAAALKSALLGSYITHLFIDELTANKLMELI